MHQSPQSFLTLKQNDLDNDDKKEEPMFKKTPRFPEDPEDSHAEYTVRAIKKEEDPEFKKERYKGQKISFFLNTGYLKIYADRQV